MAKIKEIWKDVPNYEGLYQASSLGNIKSFDRVVPSKAGSFRTVKGRHRLKKFINSRGYYVVNLINKRLTKQIRIHRLVALTFLERKPGTVVDHINNVKTDNRLCNLQWITSRENTSKDRPIKSSKYIGVSRDKGSHIFRVYIFIAETKRNKYLGSFLNEDEAGEAYQTALKQLVA